MTPLLRTAAFLDRDGTLIDDAHHLANVAGIRLVPGAVDAIKALNRAGVVVVIVTNQSGIARRLITPEEYQAVRARVEELFRDRGGVIDASYHCPHLPEISGVCECRKPLAGMHRQAAAELGLHTVGAMCAGDRRRDAEPALQLGGVGFVVPSSTTPDDEIVWARERSMLADDLPQAVSRFLRTLPT